MANSVMKVTLIIQILEIMEMRDVVVMTNPPPPHQ